MPYPNSPQLVRIFRTSPHSQSWPHSVPGLIAQRERNTVFERLAVYNGISPNLAEEGEAAERLSGYAVTADFFPTLGVQAALGRAFTAEEDQPGNNLVVVLSDHFWQRRFASDPNIVGRTLRLDGENVKVVGVMPPGFDHPLLWGTVDVWRPLAFTPEQQAQQAMTLLGAELVRERPLNHIEGQPEPQPGQWPEIYFEPVNLNYFETLGIRLLAGRNFNATDTSDKPPVLIINETTARRFWPNENAVGKRIGRPGDNPNWHEVIGVVKDIAFPANLGEPYTRFQAFRPLAQNTNNSATITMRGALSPESLLNPLRSAVAELDSRQPVHRLRSARSLVEQGLGNIALLGTLLGAFAALGLGLAAIGIYGVISYTVVQRTGEFGIRLALGAEPKDVLWLVLRKGGQLIFLGAVLGIGGAYAVAQLLTSALPTLPTRDPLTIATIAGTLIVVALAACYLPARRATKVDPLVALRSE